MDQPFNEFGSPEPGVEYVPRPGGYAIIHDDEGKIAVVSGTIGCFLPGGGRNAGETAAEAAIRESLEECGLRIDITDRIAAADELIFAESEGVHFRKQCVFFAARPTGRAGVGEPDLRLVWLSPEEALRRLREPSQRWAVALACGLPADDTMFAPYEPAATPRAAPRRLAIREATPNDVSAVARIIQQRDGGLLTDHREGLGRGLARGGDRCQIIVAEVDDEIVGFARSELFEPPADAPPGTAPAGWYLAGLVVTPEQRRRGIGLALTRERLRRLAGRARQVFYFGNVLNRATIDLHERAGFVEITRDFTFPEASFRGGVGVLCRVDVADAVE